MEKKLTENWNLLDFYTQDSPELNYAHNALFPHDLLWPKVSSSFYVENHSVKTVFNYSAF